jgi:hypothetical protein
MLIFRFVQPFTVAVALTFVCSGVNLLLCQASGQESPSVDSIIRDWKQRQEHFQTLSFTWTAEMTWVKGSLLGKPSSSGTPTPGQSHKITPAEDVTQNSHMTLKVKGGWIGYTRDGPQWTPAIEQFLPERYEYSFDGSDSKDFFEKTEKEPVDHPVGYVNVEKKPDVTNYEFWPILLHYRAIDPKVGRFSSAQWTIVQTGVRLRERDCALLKWTDANVGEEMCWVDTARQSAILRHIVKTNGYVIQTDIDYKAVPQQGWVPSSWKIQDLSADLRKIKLSSTATVTTAILNEPLNDEEFRLNFPPGTEVMDRPAKQTYLIEPNGTKRIITQEERLRDATYEDFLKTKSGMARAPQSSVWAVWGKWLVLFALSVLAAVCAYVFWKRFGRTERVK